MMNSHIRYCLSLLALALSLLACSTASMIEVDPTPTKTVVSSIEENAGAVYWPLAARTAETGGAEAEELTVCADALNVRSGPALTAPVVAWLRRGETVSVLESRDGWSHVQAGPVSGWVKGVYLC